MLVGDAERVGACVHATGTPLASWLGLVETVSGREATRAVCQGRSLVEHPRLSEAALAGSVSVVQAQAICRVLDSVAPDLSPEQQGNAEQVLVEWAGRLDATRLARSAGRVLAEVVSDGGDEFAERRLQREAALAVRERSLRFIDRGASMGFAGSLPRVEAEQWLAQLAAHGEQDTGPASCRNRERSNPHHAAPVPPGFPSSPAAPSGRHPAPAIHPQGRPGSPVRHSTIGAVLRPAAAAHHRRAHHIEPWWSGGPTAMSNLVLLCHHHHALVEPARFATLDQWQVRIASDGLPEFIPPARLDPDRLPVRHQRHAADGGRASPRAA